ncbi:hypothetical protein JMJ35_000567 [Cladonia borealis]|uniref:Uncharacterized protein n=1 Tax=Cladonia borealis TaxID=184061 RepID=A0AA39R9K5_9LECA|nr:hypothetical protein JMJ35_000567 [Cladonia borealis]
MSTHTSSKPSLESLQKRLEFLHKRRYNLDADFISIRQDVGVMIDRHTDVREVVYQLLLRRACNNYLRQYAAHTPYGTHFQVAGIDVEILAGRRYLEKIETRMSERMKTLRDLREISEFE